MVEAQTWATRRMSNPRLDANSTTTKADQVLDISTTPFFTVIFALLITCNKESAEVYCAGEDRVHIVIFEECGCVFVGIYNWFNGPDALDFFLSNLYANVNEELRIFMD